MSREQVNKQFSKYQIFQCFFVKLFLKMVRIGNLLISGGGEVGKASALLSFRGGCCDVIPSGGPEDRSRGICLCCQTSRLPLEVTRKHSG